MKIALNRGHEIVKRIDIDNQHEFTAPVIQKADVAIEFTSPHTAFENVKKCIEYNVPVICGTTGWTDKLEQIKKLNAEKKGAFLYASNFSVGVNIFFELNKKLAELMAHQLDYEVQLQEIHHTQKKDAPSGTAITLAEQILKSITRKKRWVNHITDSAEELEILSERIDPAAGTHKVRYSSVVDDIEIIHTAHSRKGFALGAVMAAEFIQNKKGFFNMNDVLGF